MIDQLQKYLLYTNLKKCQFHQNEVRFLSYIVSYQSMQIEKREIKTIYDWSKLQSIYNIQVFLRFANFYWQFIQEFNRPATLFIFILKTTLAIGSEDKNSEQSSQKI